MCVQLCAQIPRQSVREKPIMLMLPWCCYLLSWFMLGTQQNIGQQPTTSCCCKQTLVISSRITSHPHLRVFFKGC